MAAHGKHSSWHSAGKFPYVTENGKYGVRHTFISVGQEVMLIFLSCERNFYMKKNAVLCGWIYQSCWYLRMPLVITPIIGSKSLTKRRKICSTTLIVVNYTFRWNNAWIKMRRCTYIVSVSVVEFITFPSNIRRKIGYYCQIARSKW